MFNTIYSKKILVSKISINNSMVLVDNNTTQNFNTNNLFGNSIYLEDDVIRSGNTLFVNDTWLFLIENWYDLEIYNISNELEPEKASNYTSLDVSYDSKMILQNNFLYIYCEDTNILHVLNCTDPMFIFEQIRYTNLNFLKNFAINDWYLYTISKNNFTIYNFENFSPLVKLDTYFNSSYNFHDFTIKGNYSYVLDELKGFVMLNITDCNNIQYIDQIILNEGLYRTAIHIKNDRLYLFESINGLQIYDISNPLTIAKISFYNLTNQAITSIFVDENIVFLLHSDGFLILDLTDLGHIESISNYTAIDYYTSFDSFLIKGNFAYLHNTYTAHFEPRTPIFIVNITDLEIPQHIFPNKEDDIWDWVERLFIIFIIIVAAIMIVPIVVFLFAAVKSIIQDIKKRDKQ